MILKFLRKVPAGMMVLESDIRKQFMLGAQNMCWEEEGQFTGEIHLEC